jgi:hypothetical protein
MSERGELRYHVPDTSRGVDLHLEGESPLTYFSGPSQLTLRVGDNVLRQMTLVSDFVLDMRIRPEELQGTDGVIALRTDQTYVPAERSRRTGDRRQLGLRIFTCELRFAK